MRKPQGALASAERRRWMVGAGSLAALALAGCAASAGRAPAPAERTADRIDVHHHLSPPAWVKLVQARGRIDGQALAWTPEKSLADMDRAGIRTAVLSITQPGVFFAGMSKEEGRRIARESNEYGARLVADHVGRFGLFATLPLTDIEGSLQELAYAVDTLQADGIGLMTSYGDRWLGDPAFAPVLEELDRRGAVVYTHPTVANCCVNLQPGISPTMIEFATDTTRTIASLLTSGATRRYPNIRWIFSHAGGTMPFLIERFTRQAQLEPRLKALFPDGVQTELRRFCYDTAQSANPAAMAALAAVVPPTSIVFGSDFPYRSAAEQVAGLGACGVFSPEELCLIERDTAAGWLPRVAADASRRA